MQHLQFKYCKYLQKTMLKHLLRKLQIMNYGTLEKLKC